MLPKLEPFSPRQTPNKSLKVNRQGLAQQLASQEVIPSMWQRTEKGSPSR